jgi:phenylacetate-CoA ligase
MLIIRGVNVFPSQIEEVLLKFEETEPHYQLIVNRKSNLDCLEVYVEMTEKLFSDEIKEIQESERKIENELYNVLNLKAKVTLVQPGYIKRTDGKAQRIIDKRNFN